MIGPEDNPADEISGEEYLRGMVEAEQQRELDEHNARGKMRQPNPLPCGCGVMGRQDLENAVDDGHCLHVSFKDIHLVYCPLHNAATDLLARLEHTTEIIKLMPAPKLGDWNWPQIVDDNLAAISRAKGQHVPT